MIWLGLLTISAYALYRLYKYMFGPSYHPGDVLRCAENAAEEFDNEDLYTETTAMSWTMPGGIKLHHMLTESRQPATTDVLCVSGGPGIASRNPWAVCQESILNETVRFHTYHARGTGKSTLPFQNLHGESFPNVLKKMDEKLGLAAQIGDIERIRRRIGVEKLCLIGHSFGGLLASLYAAEFPRRVQSLVLLSPANLLCLPADGKDIFTIIRERLGSESEQKDFDKAVKQLLNFSTLTKEDEGTMQARQMRVFKFYEKVDPATEEITQRLDDGIGGWTAFATMCSLGMQFDYRKGLTSRLANATFRTVIVNGSEDICSADVAQKYERLFPRGSVECKVLPTGHFAHEEMSAELAKVIRSTVLSAV